MRKKNFNIIKKSIFAILTFILIVFAIIVAPSINPNNKNKIILSAASWTSKQAEIEKVVHSDTKNYVSILEFVTLNENKYISIDGKETLNPDYLLVESVSIPSGFDKSTSFITISNGLELYYFTEICNPFLANKNVNNDYEDCLTFN